MAINGIFQVWLFLFLEFRCYDMMFFIYGLGWVGFYDFDRFVCILYLCMSYNPVFVILGFSIFCASVYSIFGSFLTQTVCMILCDCMICGGIMLNNDYDKIMVILVTRLIVYLVMPFLVL